MALQRFMSSKPRQMLLSSLKGTLVAKQQPQTKVEDSTAGDAQPLSNDNAETGTIATVSLRLSKISRILSIGSTNTSGPEQIVRRAEHYSGRTSSPQSLLFFEYPPNPSPAS